MKNGKFDDFKKAPDVHLEDIYGIDPDAAASQNAIKQARGMDRLEQRVAQQKVEDPIYQEVLEIDKTMDLIFIDGILHQKVVEKNYTMEVMSGESKLNTSIEKWVKIENNNSQS